MLIFDINTEGPNKTPCGQVIVDSNLDAAQHYWGGEGEPVVIGPETNSLLENHSTVQNQLDRLKDGTANVLDGNLSVDMESDMYHLGNTGVAFSTSCDEGFCTTTFTGYVEVEPGTNNITGADGAWDITGSGSDHAGPDDELWGGNPYPYEPHTWSVTYADNFDKK